MHRKNYYILLSFLLALSFTLQARASLSLDQTSITSDGALTFTNSSGTLTLPTTLGTAGQFLQTDGTGLTSWSTPAGGIGSELLTNKSLNILTDGTSDTKYPSVKAVKDYADSKILGLLNYRGGYNASSNTYPVIAGSGTGGAILKGDTFIISNAGTLNGNDIQVGDSITANIDTPGQTGANWNTLNTNISYVPENVANKNQANGYLGLDAIGNATLGTPTPVVGAPAGSLNFAGNLYQNGTLVGGGGLPAGSVVTGSDLALPGNLTVGTTVLGLPGGVGDGVTDNTAALQAWLNANATYGATLVIPATATYRIDGQISIPYSNVSPFGSAPFRITGSGSNVLETDTLTTLINAMPSGGSSLDLRFAGDRILGYGSGTLEVDHITILNKGTNCGTFFYTTLTSLKLHDNAIYGSANFLAACDDVWRGGGTNAVNGTIVDSPNQYFQGYGSSVLNNFADRIRRLVYGIGSFNGIPIQGNTVYWRSGSNLTTSITAATNASAAVLTSVNNGFGPVTNYIPINLNFSGFTGNWAPLNGRHTVMPVNGNSFSVAIDSTGFGALTGSPVFGSGAIIELNGSVNPAPVYNQITGNMFSPWHYAHAVTLVAANNNNVTGNACDPVDTSSFVSCYRVDVNSQGNLFSAFHSPDPFLIGGGELNVPSKMGYQNNGTSRVDDTGATVPFFAFDTDLKARWRDARFGFAWRVGATDGLQVTNQGVQIIGSADPGCSSGSAGILRYSGHTAGVKDVIQMCAADAANAWAWRVIY